MPAALWPTLQTALLAGPSSTRQLAARTGRSLAAVNRCLRRHQAQLLVAPPHASPALSPARSRPPRVVGLRQVSLFTTPPRSEVP